VISDMKSEDSVISSINQDLLIRVLTSLSSATSVPPLNRLQTEPIQKEQIDEFEVSYLFNAFDRFITSRTRI
jgi:hypothetical protein